MDRYVLSDRLDIERRDGTSILQGITDKTLFTSAIYLREHFELPVLLVEGEVDYEYTYFDPQAVRGAVSSMVLLYGMTVLATPDLEETVQLILMMARQEQIGIGDIAHFKRRSSPRRHAAEWMRCSRLRAGCRARTLQHFGSVGDIWRDLENCGPSGIGQKIAAEMRWS